MCPRSSWISTKYNARITSFAVYSSYGLIRNFRVISHCPYLLSLSSFKSPALLLRICVRPNSLCLISNLRFCLIFICVGGGKRCSTFFFKIFVVFWMLIWSAVILTMSHSFVYVLFSFINYRNNCVRYIWIKGGISKIILKDIKSL